MKQKSRGKTPKPDSKSSKTSGCSPRSPFLRAARASRRSPGQCGCLTAVSVGQLSGGYVGAGQYSADQSGKSPHLPLPGPPTRHLFKLTKSPMQILLVGGVHRGISLLVLIGEGNGTPLQYSCLENPMDGGAWKAAVHGVAEGWTRLSYFTFTFMHWRRKW